MLTTSKTVLFPGHNHLLTTGTDDPNTLIIAWVPTRVIIKCQGHQHRWLWHGNRTFLEVASVVITWWIVGFLRSEKYFGHVSDCWLFQVWECFTPDKQRVAIKCVSFENVDSTTINSYRNEISLLQRLQHSHRVIKLYDLWVFESLIKPLPLVFLLHRFSQRLLRS